MAHDASTRIPFRKYHLLAILEQFTEKKVPLDVFLRNYFLTNKAVGSKDRAFIADNIYSMIRWKGLLDHIAGSHPTWEKRWQILHSNAWEKEQNNSAIPLHIRCSFPKFLFDSLSNAFGKDQAAEICRILNTSAPTTIRANTLKITRDALLERLASQYNVEPCAVSPYGIVFRKKIHFFSLPEFKDGLFEVQDEGSQLLGALLQAKPGDQVLDFCAGSGGKTLAFAPSMEGKGQIYLHDIRPTALLEAKKRLKRAGVQNAQILQPGDPKFSSLKRKMHWIFLDVPCSGTGTLRRNPDMKWKLSEATIENLKATQREIFAAALPYLHPQGKIVYATCSLLPEENQEQVDYLCKEHGLMQIGEAFQPLPQKDGMDGFFGAVLKKSALCYHPPQL